ncbi:unnamed protein product, partial [Ceratitis capitata]
INLTPWIFGFADDIDLAFDIEINKLRLIFGDKPTNINYMKIAEKVRFLLFKEVCNSIA